MGPAGAGFYDHGGFAIDPQGAEGRFDASSSSEHSEDNHGAWQYGEANFEHPGWPFLDAQRLEQRLPHPSVPKRTDFMQNRVDDGQSITTIMVRNVPNRCTRNGLVRELERLGLKDRFDFLYLPIDQSTQRSVGYAFVNFVDHESAALAARQLTDHRFPQFPRTRPMQVSPAHIQGLEANLKHYSNTAVLGAAVDAHRPLVLSQSVATTSPSNTLPTEATPLAQAPAIDKNFKAPVAAAAPLSQNLAIDKHLKLSSVNLVPAAAGGRQKPKTAEFFCARAA